MTCIVHLNSDHFVYVKARFGDVYHVVDSAADLGRVMVTPEELAVEATAIIKTKPATTPGGKRQKSNEERHLCQLFACLDLTPLPLGTLGGSGRRLRKWWRKESSRRN